MYENYKERAQFFATLPLEYKPSRRKNPNPPVLNFGIPICLDSLMEYAVWAGELTPADLASDSLCPIVPYSAVEVLSEVCACKLRLVAPKIPTSKCEAIISLYSNYDYKGKQLVEKDEQNVLDMIRAELELEDDVQAAWYFDSRDPWIPKRIMTR